MYYYPCNMVEKANAYLQGNSFFVIEVTEGEWEVLIELDRLDYNNWHKYYRHNVPFPEDEEMLSLAEQEKYSDKDSSFEIVSLEKIDRNRALNILTKKERQIYKLSIDNQYKQEEIASMLGITQGAVSATFNRARRKLDEYYINSADNQNEKVWKLWNIFLRDRKLPSDIATGVECVMQALLNDIELFLKGFSSVGELVRYIMRYYLFDEDKLDEDISNYRSNSMQKEREYFNKYYGKQPLKVQGVYVRLCEEIKRRETSKQQDSNREHDTAYTAIEKLASKLDMTVKDYFIERIYPYFVQTKSKQNKDNK